MVPLTHPTIVDGWFREISSQWPGQAITLKVNKILHVEKSPYQDVLVFESETYGNVLVLDGITQCTERDEFSYQEMIAHLPLASHPNPKKVLVIGGGDGGVVREVLKHETVKHVVLCDIDEAVIRVAKKYLPNMSSVLTDPRVTVHIGDGFKFLSDNERTYDVIITDSSDPVGPAEALFQKPYFKLLHDALAPGGHISNQGECPWLNLNFIQEMRKFTTEIFVTTEYAYSSVPTYPTGQIGFVLCTKAPGRNIRVPVREVKNCRYYNGDVHKAAFVLPEFAKTLLEDDKDIRPKFGRAAKAVKAEALNSSTKNILLLGSGFAAHPCAEYIVRDPTNRLTIASRNLSSAQALAYSLPATAVMFLDLNNTETLEKAVAGHDLVISLVPCTFHAAVIRAAIKCKTHVVTASYISPAMRELDAEAKAAGIVVFNEIGLEPGIDHLYAVKTINEVHAKGGKGSLATVKKFLSYCGGIPAPECADNPLGYMFTRSSREVLLALMNGASYIDNSKVHTIEGFELLDEAKPYYISPAFAFVAYPSLDSTPFRELYGIPEAETVVRGTLRYQGFPEIVQTLVKLGWLDQTEKDWLNDSITWKQITKVLVGTSIQDDLSEAAIVERVKAETEFSSQAEAERSVSCLRWIGIFSDEQVQPRAGNLFDILCARLEELMKYKAGERDLVMLQQKFVVEWADGRQQILTSKLEIYGSTEPEGCSAMSRAVGVPCGIASQLILYGVLNEPGVHAPYTLEICEPLRRILEAEGLVPTERGS